MKSVLNNVRMKTIGLQNKVICRLAGCKMEKGDYLLEILGAIIVAIVVLILFKGKITNLFNTAMNTADTKVNGLFN